MLLQALALLRDYVEKGLSLRDFIQDQMGEILTQVGDIHCKAAATHLANASIADHTPDDELKLAIGDLEAAYHLYRATLPEKWIDHIKLFLRESFGDWKVVECYEKMVCCSVLQCFLYRCLHQPSLVQKYRQRAQTDFQKYITIWSDSARPDRQTDKYAVFYYKQRERAWREGLTYREQLFQQLLQFLTERQIEDQLLS